MSGAGACDVFNPTFIARQAAAAPMTLAHLPALVTGFTGREAELAQIAGLLDPAAGTGAVVVSAVAGLAEGAPPVPAFNFPQTGLAGAWRGGAVVPGSRRAWPG